MQQLVSYRAVMTAAILMCSAGHVLLAGESYAQDPVETACVLLRNHNVLFGKAIQRGDQVLIQRDNGSQLQVSRRDVLCWGDNVNDLYKYRVDHRMTNTASEHLETARWCMKYELFEGALAELRLAQTLRIDQSEITRLKQQLYRTVIAKQKSKANKADNSKPPASTSGVVQASYEQEQPAPKEPAATETVDPNTLRQFATLQPTLVNRCGRCHNSRSDLKWQLFLPLSGSRLSSRLTRENLVATLAQVNFNAPLESPLWVRSTDGHAGKKNTFGPRDAIIVRSLEYWLENARPAGSPLSRAKRAYENSSAKPNDHDSLKSDLENDSLVSPQVGENTDDVSAESESDPKSVARLPVANPFDPEIFNRKMQRK